MSEEMQQIAVHVQSSYGVKYRRPMVALTLGELTVDMPVADALAVAMSLNLAASAAISEATLIEALGGEGLTTEEVAVLLERLRGARVVIDEQEGMSGK